MSLQKRRPGASRDPGAARTILSSLLLLLALLLVLPARAQQLFPSSGRSGDSLSVSILTFGPGAIYWERFGHNAILVRDNADGTAVAYNYGIFDFSQKNFMLNFARGYMQYRMAADPLDFDLDIYRREGRWVQEQKLNLTPQQRVLLADFLAWNARPENMRYRYDYFVSNCSTKVRDALDRALGGALKQQLEATPTPYSYRYDAVRLISPDFWAGIGMDLALGPAADRPLNLQQESFVPMVLMRALRQVRIKDADGRQQPLVSGEVQLLQARLPDDPAQPPDWRLPFLLLGLGFAVLLVFLDWQRRRPLARAAFAALAGAFSLACGVSGLILLAMWMLTQHWAGWHNQNLLLLNPLSLLLVPAWIGSIRSTWRPRNWSRRISWMLAILAGLALVIRLIPGWYQANLAWILLLLPAQAVQAYSLVGARRL